jgi:hypothetical protein
MSEVIRHNKIDVSKLNYTKPLNQKNVYYGPINYDNVPFYIQTNKVTFIEIKEENKQKYIVIKVDPNDFSLYDSLMKLDDHNLSSTYTSSKEWFNKDLPMDVLEGMYRRMTQPFKKDDVPHISLKLPYHNQQNQSKIYDQSNNTINIDSLTPGSNLICIIHIKGLKFLKKDYYCDNYISQIKLCETITYSIPGTCLIEDDGDDENDKDVNNVYDYEILDEEIIIKNKKKVELEGKYRELEKTIMVSQKELTELRQIIDNLK